MGTILQTNLTNFVILLHIVRINSIFNNMKQKQFNFLARQKKTGRQLFTYVKHVQ